MVKSKTFASRKQAERHIRILTSDEPWREWDPQKGPDDWACCGGFHDGECACGGLTCAEARDKARENLPPITWIRLEERKITSTPFVEIEHKVLIEAEAVKVE